MPIGALGRVANTNIGRLLAVVVFAGAALLPLSASAAGDGKANLNLTVSGPSAIEASVPPAYSRLVYRVSWSNAGPDTATNAQVLVTFPSTALQWDYFDTTCNWQYATYPNTVSCQLGSLPAGASGWFYFDFVPQTIGTYQVKFAMTALQDNPSPKTSRTTQTIQVVAPYHADLFTSINENLYYVYAQQPMTFQLSAGNNGPAQATNVVDTIQFSSGLTFDASGSDTRCTGSGQLVTCALGTLAVSPGTPQYLAINAIPAAAGSYTASATISGDQPDQDTSNNTASWTQQVQPAQADLTMSFPGTYPTELIGRPVPMLVTYRNSGPNDASGVVLQVVFPSGWTPDPAASDSPCASTSGTTLICNLGVVAAGASGQVTAAGVPSASGSFTVNGSIASDLPDPYPGNNSSSTTVPVG